MEHLISTNIEITPLQPTEIIATNIEITSLTRNKRATLNGFSLYCDMIYHKNLF